MNKKTRLGLVLVMVMLALVLVAAPALASGETYVIPIKDDIDNGNLLFIQRAYAEAVAADAAAVIFEIDTYGGYVDSAISIKDLILAAELPTYCFVDSKAISAGALIALAGETLVLTPGATMGAAEPRALNQPVDEKTLSMWVGQLSGAAEARGRDGQIAAAMADSSIVIEDLSAEGKLVTLNASQAIEYKMADLVLDSRRALIEHYQLPANVVEAERSFQEKLGGWLSNPLVSGVLLVIGIAGIVIELLTAGSFGIFGAAGLISFALYFIGHFAVGNIGMGAILLFVVGLVLIILEIFVIPGFGVAGVLGILSVLTSLILASPSFTTGILTLAIALVVAILIIVFTLKNKKTRKVWSKMILFHKQENAEGYQSADSSLGAYLGQRGHALTTLRPAGTAEIGGRRLDVVTAGEFIEAGQEIEVILVEGLRVVVQEAQQPPPPTDELE